MGVVLTDAYAFAKKYIQPGKTVLWCGRPERGSRHTQDDLTDADGALRALEQMRQNVRQNPQEEDDSVEW